VRRIAVSTPSDSEVDQRASLASTIRSLPLPYREVVVLCELQEMDYGAAAAIAECPVGTVRSRLHRARALLMSKLAAMQPAQPGTFVVAKVK